MIIRDRAALWRLLTNPLLHFGDDYSIGRNEIEGGLAPFMETVYRAMARTSRFRRTSEPAASRRNQPNLNSLTESRQNIHHHYDIGNAFYELWLDQDMLYTCAYFPDPAASREDAQGAKMDLVCRKLRLKAGQSVVETGCGWGALARHMAGRYGVNVRAYNISHERIDYARHRAKAEGLARQVEYIEDNYRNITGTYDAFVSVGMLEHVGPDHYRERGKVINRCLFEDGLGLIHTIGQNSAVPMSPWFLKRIFPGSYPPTLREMMEIFEPTEFTVLDVENLRLHMTEPKRAIDDVTDTTGIEFSCHDLRRTFTTVAESLDISRYTIKALLNYRQDSGDVRPESTERVSPIAIPTTGKITAPITKQAVAVKNHWFVHTFNIDC